MSCPPEKCASCSRPCSSKQNGDDGDLSARLEQALLRAKRAEEAFEDLQRTAAQNGSTQKHELKPLRSQAWFNNGQFSRISRNDLPWPSYAAGRSCAETGKDRKKVG